MTKLILAAALAALLPIGALAQNAADTAKPKAAAKPAAKAPAKTGTKTASQKPAKKQISRSATKAVEEVTPIEDDPKLVLAPAELEVAKRVYTGKIDCELGADVTITEDEKKPGFFNVSTKSARYRMHPVESRTGAVRLEDPRAGAMWLQLGNKSMLMNQKIGERLADDCKAPSQLAMAEEMKKNPPKALFEGADAPAADTPPPAAAPAAAPAKKAAHASGHATKK